MEQDEKDFWIALGLWAAVAVTVLSAGLFGLMEGIYLLGGVLTLVATIAIVYIAFHLRGRQLRLSFQHLLFGALLLTWVFLGYDIYDRHRTPLGSEAWDDSQPLERVYGSERQFMHETVVLDGKHFIDPVFQDVTFVYEGAGAIQMDNPRFIPDKDGAIGRLASNNKVVTQTIALDHILFSAIGCRTSLINLGPKARMEGLKGPSQ